MIHAVTFSGFARRHTESRELSAVYAATLRRRARALEEFTGESVLALVLTEANVNAFLAVQAGKSPWTIRGIRADILTLWLAAADDGLVPYPATRRIRKTRCPELLVECYSVEEARQLLANVGALRGGYPNGVGKALYWSAAIRLAWDTGLRRGDVWRFRRDAIRPDGTARVIQNKTRQVVTIRLRPSTIAALDAIDSPTPCEWPLTASRFGRHFKRLRTAAGIRRGTFKFLRRSSGSYVEVERPGAGSKHLGHRTPGIFAKHYDARLGDGQLTLPPEL